MLVLFRSSFLAFDLEIELARCNIPYIKRGGYKFMETAHVKDVLSHLRITVNPRDAVSWNRLLLLIEGIGPRTSQGIIRKVSDSGTPGGFVEGLKSFTSGSRFSSRIEELRRLFEKLDQEHASPAEQIGWVAQYYLPLLKSRYDDYPKRIKDLEHLQVIAEGYREMGSLLNDLALEPPNESVSEVIPAESEESDDERLILSTIHSAKGLEWHTVFLLWALDGRIPSLYSLATEEELEEERRLFYVALTRAKENLLITYPIRIFDRVTGRVLSRPSRFVEEVPKGLLEPWALVEEK